jgi:serine/threonine protein phosphatase PrpC
VQIQAGDRFLLCADGLSGVVSDEQMLDFILQKECVQECADGLGQLALDACSRDHISCIVIEVAEVKEEELTRDTEPQSRQTYSSSLWLCVCG